jgi:hypothetical protein
LKLSVDLTKSLPWLLFGDLLREIPFFLGSGAVPGPVEKLRPSFLPSAFFTSGTGLWDGRYIPSVEDYSMWLILCIFDDLL